MTRLRDRLQALVDALPPGGAVLLPAAELREWLAAEPDTPPAPSRHPEPERLLTVRETAERLGVTPRWVWDHATALGAVRPSPRKLRIPESGLTRHLRRTAA